MQTKQRLFKPVEPTDGELIPLHARVEYITFHEELVALESLHAQKQKERLKILAKARGEKTKRTAAERAADLLAGGRVDPTPPGPALTALDEEIAILRTAIYEKTRTLDAVASELSSVEEQRARPAFNAAMARAFLSLEAAVAAFAEGEGVAGRLRAAGYRPTSVTMPDLTPPGVAHLRMTELERMRRELVALGAL